MNLISLLTFFLNTMIIRCKHTCAFRKLLCKKKSSVAYLSNLLRIIKSLKAYIFHLFNVKNRFKKTLNLKKLHVEASSIVNIILSFKI